MIPVDLVHFHAIVTDILPEHMEIMVRRLAVLTTTAQRAGNGNATVGRYLAEHLDRLRGAGQSDDKCPK